MSTQDMELLRLYRDTKLYNGSRYKVYQNNKTMDDYLGNPDYEKYVNYKSISEPILINEAVKNCDEYTYGSISNEGKTYYFFVDQISTDAYYKTTIEYTIDWWSTNWEQIRCTKAHVIRQNKSKPGYMLQPASNLNMTITQETYTDDFCYMATYIPSTEKGTSFISYIIMEGNIHNSNIVQLGYWHDVYEIPGSDIKDCFVVPLFKYSDFVGTGAYYVVNTTEVEGSDLRTKIFNSLTKNGFNNLWQAGEYIYDSSSGKYYLIYVETGGDIEFQEVDYPSPTMLAEYYAKGDGHGHILDKYKMFKLKKDSDESMIYTISKFENTFTSTEIAKQGIIDWNGNLIWECPQGISNIGFFIRLLLGISHILLEFTPNDNTNNTEMITGKAFCYDCRHPGLFVDSYKEYIMKNRDYDIEMRRIQTEKQNIQAWSSVAENIGFGKAFGKNIGGIAAGVGSVIEAATTYIVNSIYDPKIQEQYDLRYARMTDQISLVGDSISNVLFAMQSNQGLLKKYTLSLSEDAQTRYNADITINGYYTDEITSTLQSSYFDIGRVIQADNVVVEGACNVVGKQQVVSRLMNGVEFI